MTPPVRVERLKLSPEQTFSDAVLVRGSGGEWIYVAGQLGINDIGVLVGPAVEDQAVACFNRIERILLRAGAKLSDLVRIGVFLTELSDYPAFAHVRGELLGPNLPTSVTVFVKQLLLDAALEIEATAFRRVEP